MDNLINNALPGLLSPLALTEGAVDAAGIALQWQQKLVTSEPAMPGKLTLIADMQMPYPRVETSSELRLQQLTLSAPQQAEKQMPYPLVDTSLMLSLQQLALQVSPEKGMADNAVTVNLLQLAAVQSIPTYGVSGHTTVTESRLLSWGNAGQGILSYLSTYPNTGFSDPYQHFWTPC
ncbi:hypothetical protein [Arsukibacterium perlucidum]|uniref:hypothetical protein n=1 Tax=Arsukibacterium perlucidum TaxID=368811 RepID=UPI000372332B|nr:hypothetical protein [Arsukibacterium perlucidum]